MKLVRYGPAGKEKPGLIDADGKLRDLSKKVKDIDAATLAPAELAKLRKLDPKKLPLVKGKPRLGPCVATPSKFVAIGLNYIDHAKETGSPIPEHPVVFFKSPTCIVGPNDNVMVPKDSTQLDWEVELGFVIGRTARYVDEEGRAQVRRRLLRHQRRVGARVPAEEERVAVEQGQGLRHVRAARAVARHDRRDQGSCRTSTCGSTSTASAGRRGNTQHDDLRRRRARGRRFEVHDAAAGRRDHDRHAARRRPGHEAAGSGSRPAT